MYAFFYYYKERKVSGKAEFVCSRWSAVGSIIVG